MRSVRDSVSTTGCGGFSPSFSKTAAKRRAAEARRLGYTRVVDDAVGLVRSAIPEAISQGRREAAPGAVAAGDRAQGAWASGEWSHGPRPVAVPDF